MGVPKSEFSPGRALTSAEAGQLAHEVLVRAQLALHADDRHRPLDRMLATGRRWIDRLPRFWLECGAIAGCALIVIAGYAAQQLA